jgi:Mrp family chromosome partitioning ATPase
MKPPDEGDFSVEFAAPAEADTRPVFDEASRVLPTRPEPVMAAVLHPGSSAWEELRMAAAKVRSFDPPLRCLGLVSASPGEGKTTLAVGLATALAQEPGRRVLLLEADLRRPAIEGYLGLPAEQGVGDWLEETLGRRVPVRRLVPQGVFLLAGGRFGGRRPELLQSRRMPPLIAAARQCFDYVVVDCPPLGPVADSLMLQDLLDGFLCVVRARHTPLDLIQKGLERLKAAKVRGVIFNDHREMLAGSYKYYERRYRTGS